MILYSQLKPLPVDGKYSVYEDAQTLFEPKKQILSYMYIKSMQGALKRKYTFLEIASQDLMLKAINQAESDA